MKSETFTVKKGIAIQKDQLEIIKFMLNAEAYCALVEECQLQNKKLAKDDDGYAVFRGSRMDEFVQNWARKQYLRAR